ncbi:MAG TPA: malto-oligosyltrehalose synthase [Streptosporangiaceae bacterium]|jgi:(1->4)-alpha-D-glucan 1-alpha-D-glucosylmutase
MRAATYRVQLHAGFTFDDAAAISGYLASLGVSHLYCSPYLQAARGSTHGYDVVDHSRLNAELGGAAGHARLTAALAGAGLRQVLDIVPNHMAVGPPDNAWWQDVLASGVESRYAGYFDIDWDPPQPLLAGKVLVPVLGDHYGRALDAGELRVARGAGGLVLRYYDHELPLARHTVAELERGSHGQASDAEIEALNSDADALDALLRRQNYRLAHWRTASEEINYRRFFDITTLAGLRAEDPQVFADTHHLILAMIHDGTLDGLRVDHVDGLADPAGYLERLQAQTGGAYVVVEKILEEGEELPASWPVAGTTGYDFVTAVGQLFTDPAGEAPMRDCYARFTGEAADWPEVVYTAKLQVMRGTLYAEVERLTELLDRVTDRHRRQRDFTRSQLRVALTEILAGFGVYRSYSYPGRPVSEADTRQVADAVAAARRRRPDLDAELAGFIGELLTGEYPGSAEADFAVHFAQVSAPVMAKGVEDTAFYRYHVLASLCEVGGDPGTFGRPMADFHASMAAAARQWPEAMLTLSTHDTKRSADVRARISLLAERPQAWEQAVTAWAAANEKHKTGGWPDRNTEYLIYQNLVGAWPIDAARAGAFAAKAVKEAKVHTSWIDPDQAYDDAVQAFVAGVLADPQFVAGLEGFLAAGQLVERGRVSSLAQAALLLTCPGVPDIYQGSEVWDLSLVDPDNRRPVDFAARERLLAALTGAGPAQALARMDEGGPKLWLIHRLLAHRARAPQAFAPGSGYEPLAVSGGKAEHVVAFTRTGGLAVIVPRLVAGLGGGPWGQGDWGGTAVTLPAGRWRDVLTGATATGGLADVETLLSRFPVTVLAPEVDVPDVMRDTGARGVAEVRRAAGLGSDA